MATKNKVKDFKWLNNTFAISFADKANSKGEIESDMSLKGDINKLTNAIVEYMKRHEEVAMMIYNAAYEFHNHESSKN